MLFKLDPHRIRQEVEERFKIPFDLLQKHSVHPFGGIVRDLYHGKSPHDLDLVTKSKARIFRFLKDLTANKDHYLMLYPSQHHNPPGYNSDTHSRVACLKTKEKHKIDILKIDFPADPMDNLDFTANAFAFDCQASGIFAWTKGSSLFKRLTKHEFSVKAAVKDLENKRLIFLKPHRGLKHLKKVLRLREAGWEISWKNVVLNFSQPTLIEGIYEIFSLEERKAILISLLTHKNTYIRLLAKYFRKNIESLESMDFIDLLKESIYSKFALLERFAWPLWDILKEGTNKLPGKEQKEIRSHIPEDLQF